MKGKGLDVGDLTGSALSGKARRPPLRITKSEAETHAQRGGEKN